ncbi:MAG: hypothetical protein AMXMBFR33_42840 [Candidatus Xenobia bacterium]
MTVARPDSTGAHRMAHTFALAFRAAGFRVGMVFGRILEPANLPQSARQMMAELAEHGVSTWYEHGFATNWSPQLVRLLADRAREQAADALVAFNQRDRKFAIWAGAQAGLPTIVSVQNQHTFHGLPIVKQVKAALYARVIRKARLLVCTSNVVQDEMVGRFGAARERTTVLPNGINPAKFGPAATREGRLWSQWGVGPDELVAANLGRLDRQKGQDLLLEAFARVAGRIPRLKLGLIGSASGLGAEFERNLRARVQSQGLSDRVVFTGWRDDTPRLLAEADLYIHSARWEGPPGGLALLEAMASHLPVAYTDCSGPLPGFEEGRHGWLVRNADVADMARALEQLASLEPARRAELGRECRRLVEERYDAEQVIAPRFVELTEGVL